MTLSGSSITGTPTTVGSTVVQLTATDSLGYTQNATQTLNIAAAPANNPPPPPAPGACSDTNAVVTNVSNLSLDIAGGLANGGQSVIYAPQVNTTFVAPLLAANGFQFGQLITYTGTLDANGFCVADSMTVAPALSLAPVTLSNAQVGSAYSSPAIIPAGGVAPYTIAVSGLPVGLSFDGTRIEGTPDLETDGTTTVSISINDNIGEIVNTTLSLTVDPAPAVIANAILLDASVGVDYLGSISASGGVGAISLFVDGLPDGLVFDSIGNVVGIPTTAGASTVTVTATDSIGQTATTAASLLVSPPPAIDLGTSVLPTTGTVGVSYSGQAKATGGVGALIWTGTGLPTGVDISPDGVISGTPSASGTFNIVLTVTDDINQTATVNASVVISGGFSCTVPPGGTGGQNSKGSITAINGNVITFRNSKGVYIKVTVPACATIQWNGGAHAFALGQVFEWNGYKTSTGTKVAQSVTIN